LGARHLIRLCSLRLPRETAALLDRLIASMGAMVAARRFDRRRMDGLRDFSLGTGGSPRSCLGRANGAWQTVWASLARYVSSSG